VPKSRFCARMPQTIAAPCACMQINAQSSRHTQCVHFRDLTGQMAVFPDALG